MKCGLVLIPTRNQSLTQYYKDDGYFKKSKNIAARKFFFSKSLLLQIAKQRVENALSLIQTDVENKRDLLTSKRILDIGCSYGEIIYYFKNKYQGKVQGIEASAQTAKYGSEQFSIKIAPLLLEEFKLKKEFDIIWASHVLEHVNDPNEFLKKIKTLIKKNGLLFVEVPNILKPTGGFDLNAFLYSEHLQTFSSYNLSLLLKNNGYKIVAYSDRGFLKFWCQLDNGRVGIKPTVIPPKQVYEFLKTYKKDYGIINSLKVYSQKMSYGIKLIIYKAKDLLIHD